jgi:hypothetical protein
LFIIVVEANSVENVPETVFEEDPISVEKYMCPMVTLLDAKVEIFTVEN